MSGWKSSGMEKHGNSVLASTRVLQVLETQNNYYWEAILKFNIKNVNDNH